jgi:hypothetical protein
MTASDYENYLITVCLFDRADRDFASVSSRSYPAAGSGSNLSGTTLSALDR